MALIPLVAVVGPTASGKTRLAVELALKYGGEVVSADSMQLYRGMDIGTAKPTVQEMRGVPHHMIDIAGVNDSYSVAQYVAAAHAVIADIAARGRLPVVAGGTGLYVDSLIDNIAFGETVRDEALRRELSECARRSGGEALLSMLRAFDPETAASLHPNNVGRIIRAIEVYRTTGITMAEARRASRETPRIYSPCVIGLHFKDRGALYRRIDARVDAMVAGGLFDEVRRLLGSGARADSTAMQAIGYKEIAGALRGETTQAEAAQAVKTATRHYAKRQLTWFRRRGETVWLEADQDFEKISQLAFAVIDKYPFV